MGGGGNRSPSGVGALKNNFLGDAYVTSTVGERMLLVFSLAKVGAP